MFFLDFATCYDFHFKHYSVTTSNIYQYFTLFFAADGCRKWKSIRELFRSLTPVDGQRNLKLIFLLETFKKHCFCFFSLD